MQATKELTRAEALVTFMVMAMSGRADMEPEEVYGPPQGSLFRYEADELDYLPAPDLETIANQLIADCNEFSQLRSEQIGYLWKKEGGKSSGKATLGKCQKVSGLLGFFTEASWVIWLAADYASDYRMSRQQIEAALYHELLHAGVDADNAKPVVLGHDFESFALEIKRYGAWHAGLKLCKESWEQPSLFELKRDGIIPRETDSVTISTQARA